ncbi:SDR family oxidoreductase [Candidatus Frankia alpina]|uniref:SDR family NAD(P)-dependent oxidoreductase n=1 Tax=Candidatus Frankia alpina TaxID=2699483 RepID=A0A4S5EQ11_9ACTN|nr:SDR family oxidoreductase [Candidatus Frankia alpina]THJ74172.1 SDR family NAD(P)-dependent oxidoreductase [Candidatus Frankia alpina]
MSGLCAGRVVIVTGGGNGIGRAHALAFAAEGARVVVNDLGCDRTGHGRDDGPAAAVVEEIRAAGGQAVANTDDVADFAGAGRLVAQAVETFGGLDVLVNNAGILRDRTLVNMTETEWDTVVRVHLKGTFAPTHHAGVYWRNEHSAGHGRAGRVVNTSSPSGLFGNIGQTNYGAAKTAIAGFTITAALELARYGVTVNAIAPLALTRMTDGLTGDLPEAQAARMTPGHIAPLVVWLGSEASAGVTGRVFAVVGGSITVLEGWVAGPTVDLDGVWDPGALGEVIPGLVRAAAPNADLTGTRPQR